MEENQDAIKQNETAKTDVKKDKKEKKASASEAAVLASRAEQAEKAAAEAKEALLRTAAEYDNFRKRSAKEKDDSFGNGVSHTINKLLPIIDTLELAANAPTTDEEYKKGVAMTLTKCAEVFKGLGVEEIDALGKPFDPEMHSAVMKQASEEAESDTIITVLQKGYTLNGKIIRHATVIVAE